MDLYRINRAAEAYFMTQMKGEYAGYMEKRKISPEVARRFGIGGSGDGLIPYMHRLGYSDDELLGANLIDESGEPFFRDRIIFPISDMKGIVGFSARLMTGEKKMKYKNTKENAIFQKGRVLYNFPRASRSGKNALVICEGQMDVIAMEEAGHMSCVALMGTALTKEHIELIRTFTSKVIFCLDGDAAGQLNAKKNGEELARNGFTVMNICLPEGHDPDEILRNEGREKLNSLLKAKTLCQAETDRIRAHYDAMGKAYGGHRLDIAYDSIDYIRRFSKTKKADIAYLSEITGFSEKALGETLEKGIGARTDDRQRHA